MWFFFLIAESLEKVELETLNDENVCYLYSLYISWLWLFIIVGENSMGRMALCY